MHFFQISTSKSGPNVLISTILTQDVLRATTACNFSTSQLPKVVRTLCVLPLLTSLRHNSVDFFHISTSTSRPTLRCFVHFHCQMCFAPQRRALFPHHNFQKWSENGVLCACSLTHVLCSTTTCTFCTSKLPTVLRNAPNMSLL